jgi:hypothetical protein
LAAVAAVAAAVVVLVALALQVPIAQYADRSRRVPLAIAGAIGWACFSGMTGLATGIVVLGIAVAGLIYALMLVKQVKLILQQIHLLLLCLVYPEIHYLITGNLE